MALHSRKDILKSVVDNIPRSCGYQVDVDDENVESVRLIEDLAFDSIDVHTLTADAADELNIPSDMVYGMNKVETLGDIVTALANAQECDAHTAQYEEKENKRHWW